MKVRPISMNEQQVRRALEMAADEEWEAARAALDAADGAIADELRTFFSRMSSRDRARRDAVAAMRHEMANAITVALANLEGMVDGAVAVTPKRLKNVCEALQRAQGLLR